MTSFAGKLIVIEGLEGAGKTTAVNTVIDLLSKKNIKIITTREPGGTVIGELLRTIIKNPEYGNVLDNKSELLLLYAARIQLLEQLIKPALQLGHWVVADRFELSTLAYQGGGRGLNSNMINMLSSFCLEGFKPDLTLYLDISPELGMERVKSRGKYDRIEQQSIDFFHRVHDEYIKYINAHSDISIIDASRPIQEVQRAIQQILVQFIESHS
jgi:dTMP kinase